MKIPKDVRLHLLAILISALAAISCTERPAASSSIVPAQVAPNQEHPCEPSLKHVAFENVSFDYDECIFGHVQAEKVPDFRLAQADFKPDGVAPEHLHFEFENGPQYWKPFVEIYPVRRFPEMYAVNKRVAQGMQQAIRDLKRVIKEPNLRFNGEIPYLPYVDAHQDLQADVKTSSFSWGNGLYFVTYFDTEVILINNDHLRYVFEGLTTDGKYYVLGEIPISLAFLDDVSANVESTSSEGFTYADLMEMLRTDEKDRKQPKYIALKKRFDSYISAVTLRIENTKPEGFEPALSKLEALIASLKIDPVGDLKTLKQ
jgi:hypothetical protein